MKFKSLVIAILFSTASLCFAETAVIVHPSAGVSSLGPDDIERIFLGKSKSLPNGNSIVPLDQDADNPARKSFTDTVLGKSPSQLKAYWSKLIFTGKGTPPKESGGDADIVNLVAANPNMIGYVDSSAVTGDVVVVHSF